MKDVLKQQVVQSNTAVDYPESLAADKSEKVNWDKHRQLRY